MRRILRTCRHCFNFQTAPYSDGMASSTTRKFLAPGPISPPEQIRRRLRFSKQPMEAWRLTLRFEKLPFGACAMIGRTMRENGENQKISGPSPSGAEKMHIPKTENAGGQNWAIAPPGVPGGEHPANGTWRIRGAIPATFAETDAFRKTGRDLDTAREVTFAAS